MLVTIIRFDDPKQAILRKSRAVVHAEYVKDKLRSKPVFAGPLFTPDGKSVIGCMIVADFKSVDGAKAFHKGDPYKIAGLFREVYIAPTKETPVKARPSGAVSVQTETSATASAVAEARRGAAPTWWARFRLGYSRGQARKSQS